jgi:hypothetical protein
MFYTIYKIINLINNKYYIGMHVTKDINDSYLGSGIGIKRAVRKYGKENFKKEILFVFDNEQDMINKEIEIVNESIVKDSNSYNDNLGGKGGWYSVNKRSSLFRAKRVSSLLHTFETTDTKKRISDSVKLYIENNPEKVKENSLKAAQALRSRTDSDKLKTSHKLSKSLLLFYRTEEGKKTKEIKSNKMKDFYETEKGKLLKEQFSEVGNSLEYLQAYYVDFNKDVLKSFLSLVINSNLGDQDIIKYLNIKHKFDSLIDFCCKSNYISLNKRDNGFIVKDMSKTTFYRKTECILIDTSILLDDFKNFRILREDYLTYFNEYLPYILGNYSDSYMYNTLRFQHYKNVLKYAEYLDILKIDHEERINIRHLFPNSQRSTGKKTIVVLNKDFKKNYILIDKEMQNEYEIESCNSGGFISYSWNRL